MSASAPRQVRFIFTCLFTSALVALGCEHSSSPSSSRASVAVSTVASASASPSIAPISVAPSDAGVTPVISAVGKSIDRIEMVSADDWWMLSEGRAWHTRDGGATFVDRTPFKVARDDEFAGPAVDSILASSHAIFILRGDGDHEDIRTRTLFVSDDGGNSFVAHAVDRNSSRGGSLQDGPGGALIIRESDDNGMNSHHETLLESLDGGRSFRKLGSKTGYGTITFQTATAWWTVGTCCASPDSIFRSTDAGRHWAVQGGIDGAGNAVGVADAQSDVVFVGPQRGYRVVTNLSGIVEFQQTTDGARSFHSPKMPFVSHEDAPAQMLEADRNACILQTDAGFFSTTDQGDTWIRLPDLPVGAPAAAKTLEGDVVAWSWNDTSSRLLRLRRGAKAWEPLTPKFG